MKNIRKTGGLTKLYRTRLVGTRSRVTRMEQFAVDRSKLYAPTAGHDLFNEINSLLPGGTTAKDIIDYSNIMMYDTTPADAFASAHQSGGREWNLCAYKAVLDSWATHFDRNQIVMGFEPTDNQPGPSDFPGMNMGKCVVEYMQQNGYTGGVMFWAANHKQGSHACELNYVWSDRLARYALNRTVSECTCSNNALDECTAQQGCGAVCTTTKDQCTPTPAPTPAPTVSAAMCGTCTTCLQVSHNTSVTPHACLQDVSKQTCETNPRGAYLWCGGETTIFTGTGSCTGDFECDANHPYCVDTSGNPCAGGTCAGFTWLRCRPKPNNGNSCGTEWTGACCCPDPAPQRRLSESSTAKNVQQEHMETVQTLARASVARWVSGRSINRGKRHARHTP